jgi:hypothetical protein
MKEPVTYTVFFPGDPLSWPTVPIGYHERLKFVSRKSRRWKSGGVPEGLWFGRLTRTKGWQVGPVPLASLVKRGYNRRR